MNTNLFLESKASDASPSILDKLPLTKLKLNKSRLKSPEIIPQIKAQFIS